MSKKEHDQSAARRRASLTDIRRGWYVSSSRTLRKAGLRKLRCLDLCSGNCEFSHILRDDFEMDVTCADYVPLHLEEATRSGYQTIEVDLDADADELDALAAKHAGQFDLVTNLAAIEHVFDTDNLLRFVHTVLAPGGHLLVNTPNISFAGYRLYSSLSGNRPFADGHHIRFWDFRFLRTNLHFNGFDVVADGRDFHALPTGPLDRAFRGNRFLVAIVSRFFFACFLLQHFPPTRGFCSDELTVLARRQEVVPTGFTRKAMEKRLAALRERPEEYDKVRTRLQTAAANGWLNEHPSTRAMVASL